MPLVSISLPFRAEGMNRLREARRDARVAIPTFDSALPMAVSLEEKIVEISAQGGLPHERRTVTDLSGGAALMSREYVDGKLSLEREYDRGIPTEERFAYDETGGFWAGRAVYERIKEAPYYRKSYLTMDSDGNGLPEYRESYYPILRKEWDFDGNGSYDVAEETKAGTVSDFFSSRLNGEFDVRVDIKAGRIVAVSRNGKEYQVRKESKADIYWIGRMPFELGAAAPASDGVYDKSGVKYLFYRSEKIGFAEVLP